MATLDEETQRKRKKIMRIVWVVFTVLSILATVFLPALLVEGSRQERERNRPAPRSYTRPR